MLSRILKTLGLVILISLAAFGIFVYAKDIGITFELVGAMTLSYAIGHFLHAIFFDTGLDVLSIVFYILGLPVSIALTAINNLHWKRIFKEHERDMKDMRKLVMVAEEPEEKRASLGHILFSTYSEGSFDYNTYRDGIFKRLNLID